MLQNISINHFEIIQAMKTIFLSTLRFAKAKVLMLLLLLLPILVFAQIGIDLEPTLDSMLNTYNAIYAALVLLWGYVAKNILKLKEITKVPFVFVVLAGALVLAAFFLTFKFSDILPLVITFLGSLGIFDLLKGGQKATVEIKSQLAKPNENANMRSV